MLNSMHLNYSMFATLRNCIDKHMHTMYVALTTLQAAVWVRAGGVDTGCAGSWTRFQCKMTLYMHMFTTVHTQTHIHRHTPVSCPGI